MPGFSDSSSSSATATGGGINFYSSPTPNWQDPITSLFVTPSAIPGQASRINYTMLAAAVVVGLIVFKRMKKNG